MSLNVGKLHAIIHLSQHEQHRNDILKTGFMVSVYVCVNYIFVLLIAFFFLYVCLWAPSFHLLKWNTNTSTDKPTN